MNLQETLELLKALRESRATHFKSSEIEVTLSHESAQSVPFVQDVKTPEPVKSHLDPEAEKAATKKLKDLIATLNMSNEDLVNVIFPAGADG